MMIRRLFLFLRTHSPLQLLWIAAFFVFLSSQPFGTPPSNLYNLMLAIALLIVITVSALFTFWQELQVCEWRDRRVHIGFFYTSGN